MENGGQQLYRNMCTPCRVDLSPNVSMRRTQRKVCLVAFSPVCDRAIWCMHLVHASSPFSSQTQLRGGSWRECRVINLKALLFPDNLDNMSRPRFQVPHHHERLCTSHQGEVQGTPIFSSHIPSFHIHNSSDAHDQMGKVSESPCFQLRDVLFAGATAPCALCAINMVCYATIMLIVSGELYH